LHSRQRMELCVRPPGRRPPQHNIGGTQLAPNGLD
jgi:hypothetical protein